MGAQKSASEYIHSNIYIIYTITLYLHVCFPIMCLFPNNLKDLSIVLKTRDLAQGFGIQGKYSTPSGILLYVLS